MGHKLKQTARRSGKLGDPNKPPKAAKPQTQQQQKAQLPPMPQPHFRQPKAAAAPMATAAPPRATSVASAAAPQQRAQSPARGNNKKWGGNSNVEMETALADGLEERGLGVYKDMFLQHKIYSVSNLRALTDQDLRNMGVKPFHAAKMLQMAAQIIVEQMKAAEESRKRKTT